MNDRLRKKHSIPALTLLAALVAVTVGFAATPAAAAPASETGDHYRPSAWAEASDAVPAGKTPSLTGSAGQPEGGTGSQLPIGLGLAGLGLLGLVFGLVQQVQGRRQAKLRPFAYIAGWPRAARPPAETGARS